MNSPSTPSRRDRRIERQRHSIMDAAARIFAEKGYAATTTKEIAQAADIGESTLYNYFGGKRDLFLAMARRQSDAIDEIITNTTRLETRPQMAQAFARVMEILLSQSHYTRALLAEAWINDDILFEMLASRLAAISQFLENLIQERVNAGTFRQIEPHLASRMAIATFIGFSLPAMRGVEPPPTAEERLALATKIIDIWMDGIEAKPCSED